MAFSLADEIKEIYDEVEVLKSYVYEGKLVPAYVAVRSVQERLDSLLQDLVRK